MIYKKTLLIFSLFFICFLIPSQVCSQKQGESPSSPEPKKLTLVHAAMCEGIKDLCKPQSRRSSISGMDFCCQIPPASCFNTESRYFQDNFKAEKDICFIKEQ